MNGNELIRAAARLITVAFAAALLTHVTTAQAQQAQGQPVAIEPASPLPAAPVAAVETAPIPLIATDAVTLEPFVDGLFANLTGSGRMPGAVVVIIRNGQVALKKGYGVTNLESRTPVDPDRTLFRVASISKLFTATAVMQLVDAGKLDLNADVNTYLEGMRIAPTFPQPVTLSHLLSHTGGFDDKFTGFGGPLEAKPESLGAHLARQMPNRVTPVGQYHNYSNYGYALAGHIVERASGEDFRAFVKARIFDPLGMTRSAFGVPAPVPAAMATPYARKMATGALEKIELDQMWPYPAGDLVTSGADMAAFMLAILNQDPKWASEDGAQKMLSVHIEPGAGPDGWGLGFASGAINGMRWVGHGGSWPGFAAEMRMSPDMKNGFFFAANVDSQFDLIQPLALALSERLWPKGQEPAKISADAQVLAGARSLVGTYMSHRRVRADFMAIAGGSGQVTITADDQGVLSLSGPFALKPLTFEPSGSGTWFERSYGWTLAPHAGTESRLDGVLLGPFLYERVSASKNFNMQVSAAVLAAAGLALGILLWVGGFAMRRLVAEPAAVIPALPKAFGLVGALVGFLFVALLLISMTAVDVQALLHGNLGMLRPLLIAPYLIVAFALGMVAIAFWGFGLGLKARLAQTWYAVMALLLGLIAAFAFAWNLHYLMI